MGLQGQLADLLLDACHYYEVLAIQPVQVEPHLVLMAVALQMRNL
jgi:hypothetical protein